MNGLQVTQAQIDQINSALPVGTRVSAIVGVDGLMYLGADLLTDIGPGCDYELAAAIIQSLTQAAFTPKPSPFTI